MKRDLYDRLLAWKSSPRRKPLLLQGARQSGKTFLLNEFGRSEYERVVYCNFEEDPALGRLFDSDLDPDRVMADLATYTGRAIRPEVDLVILDEIQTSNAALGSLKYLQEHAGGYHIAAAGSLLGIKLSSPGSFPVGKVNFLYLHPMTFLEFLDAMGESRYRVLLEETTDLRPLNEAFHRRLIDLLRIYHFIGGMPEAVKVFAESREADAAREVHHEIIKSYVLDFAKHAPTSDIPKLTLIWESIPKHLARENRRFVFSAVKKGARAREYENALIWLEDAGLIHRALAVETSRHPLAHYADRSSFKAYALDVGLLGAMARVPARLMAQGERLFNEYEGAFVESYVAQQLTAVDHPLFYWRSKGGKAELDFLCELEDRIVPLEVKAGLNPKSKSLRSYDQQYSPDLLVRTNLLNLKKDGKICNIPLYAVPLLKQIISGQEPTEDASWS